MRQKVQLFSATLAVLAMTSIAAEPADEIRQVAIAIGFTSTR